jgi:thiamine biosynthesis lipoprotein
MGTIVTIHVITTASAAETAIDRAFGWFHEIEQRCTRFNEQSELMQLCAQPGVSVPVSAILFEAIQFALLVAEESGGAFDPTVGHSMTARGFNREHRTRDLLPPSPGCDPAATWRDIALDSAAKTITLQRPLTLDLGAVAKGLAVDTAATELAPFTNFSIDAGGDLYLGGTNHRGLPWSVGIRHPRQPDEVIASLHASNQAVCTSGDYERPLPANNPSEHHGQHHILDPRTGASPNTVASATVVAPTAMLADALGTAVFVLGPQPGIQFLDRLGVEGLIVTPALELYETRGLRRAA